MTHSITRFKSLFMIALVATGFLASCGGEDYMPVYFPPPEAEKEAAPAPSQGAERRSCTLSFTSQLCVAIKGDNIEAGATDGDSLCAEVPAFPIHISGSKATILGSEFPDIEVEGHGLPVPIIINGRGDGDGSSNTGEGSVDGTGSMTIENFSIFISALGIVGEVPSLTLTTGTSEETKHLDPITGSPPDVSGAMTLVTATTLGHVIDAADEYLYGASMTATFKGSVTPTLAQCAGNSERQFKVTKLTIDESGKQTDSEIPGGNRMEISAGTYIAESDADVGERFQKAVKFRVTNISSQPIAIRIPPQKGSFNLSSTSTPLSGTVRANQSFILNVTFRPTLANAEPGELSESIPIGSDQFFLVGTAFSQSGETSVSILGEDGSVAKPDVDDITVGSAEVGASAQRGFFLCKEIECTSGVHSFTACGECPDPSANPCELLPISTSGRPMGEVDESCRLAEPDAVPLLAIDLKSGTNIELKAQKQVVAIRNSGVSDLEVLSVSIEESAGSKSTGEFSIPPNAIFISKSTAGIQEKTRRALEGNLDSSAAFPVTLPPYYPGYDETTMYVVVTYIPNDLVGSDGGQAGVGSRATDRATMKITTQGGDIQTLITATTTILESPALELFFRTSTGLKHIPNGMPFSFKGVTAESTDVAVPVFLRVTDTATRAQRITSISVEGDDKELFRWLDTEGAIAQVSPETGKGIRCSIFQVDEQTGEVLDESFDLKPVAITPPGFDMAPGEYSTANMPLFGCVDFHRDAGSPITKRYFEAKLVVNALEIDEAGLPAKNPDGSSRNTELSARLLAAIDPRSGKLVMRITQTMAVILNQQFPNISASGTREEYEYDIASGDMTEKDIQVFTSALILDPFDEDEIRTSDGGEVLTGPGDGVTGVFRKLDTHPVSAPYDDDSLFDYSSLLNDAGLAPGKRGIFADYPNSEHAYANGWRIFTATLSYPGPLAPRERRPDTIRDCEVVNPCSPEGLRKFTDAGVPRGEKGACAFFNASGGRYDSPSMHYASEMPGGERTNLCNMVDEPQNLYDIDTGRYSVDGRIDFEEVGLKFFGPTYFHNPGGPFGEKDPLDEVWHLAFTSGALAPQENSEEPNVLPDERINIARGEFLVNLDDPTGINPGICDNNTKNRVVGGKRYSSWKYMQKLLFKDKEGTVPAGCPEEDNDFTGGQAFLRGRDVDHETGIMTLITAGKFSSSEDLTFAFKDVMMFLVLNGWLCDPTGSEEDFEGSRCYDIHINERDAAGQLGIMD